MVSEVWVHVDRGGHFWGDGEFDRYVLGLTGLQEGREGRKDVYYDVMMSFFICYLLLNRVPTYIHVGTCLGGGCIHLY